jgi:DNA transposition AAA+ family ATPase
MSATNKEEPKQTEPLNERAERARVKHALSIRKLAQVLGIEGLLDSAALGRWLKGDNIQERKAVEEAATQWLADLERPSHERRMTPFVETGLAEQIMSALLWAKAQGEMVTVIGEPGLGKTRAIRQVQDAYPDVWVATMDPAASALVPALQRVAEAVGIISATGGASALARDVRGKVDGRNGLLIIDEMQHLGLPALDQIRSIHDSTDLAIALVGNEYSYARMTAQAKAAHYGQIRSRIGMHVALGRPGYDDVEALAARYGIKDEKTIKALTKAARHHGTLRNVSKALLQATAGHHRATSARVMAALTNLRLGSLTDNEEGEE